jgi:hypothetical protein
VTPDRRRPGIRGSAERLNRQYPLASAAPADGEPGRGAVRVRLTGHPDDLAKLLPTLPGLNITRVASAAELVDGEYATHVEATIQAGVHHYLSSACLHEALFPDAAAAAELHAYCAGQQGACGHKTPAVCKWCPAPCACPGHQPCG